MDVERTETHKRSYSYLKEDSIPNGLKKFCNFVEDDGDFASIFPANEFTKQEIIDYTNIIGKCFRQELIDNLSEFRVYIIGSQVISYRREQLLDVDKSSAGYQIETNGINICSQTRNTKNDVKEKLITYCDKFKLGYLCLDIIESDKKQYVVDINPYGSLPNFKKDPYITELLADYLIKIASGYNTAIPAVSGA